VSSARAVLEAAGLDRPEAGDDAVVPFAVEALDCRGRAVRLGPALDAILSRHDYPAPVARLLGEAVVLTVLIGTSLKFEGKFILQTQTDGPVGLLVADLHQADGIRAYARFDDAALQKSADLGHLSPAELLGDGALAMTVDQGPLMDRYQGIVELNGATLEDVAHRYFAQSEQIPTAVRLAIGQFARKGDDRAHWRGGGVLLQYLPPGNRRLMPDLPGDGDFDSPEAADAGHFDDDRWTEARAHLSTLGDDELVDPDISPERLLFRLYHERGVRVFNPQPVEDRCTCSADKVEAMLAGFDAAQRAEMAAGGEIEVKCDFCSTVYRFNPNLFGLED
jgi:molecular chaperone Hsp33